MREFRLILKILYFVCAWMQRQVQAKDFVAPNIIIIMADDLGIDDVSFRGSREFITPNIDALAYHGKILNRHYTPSMCTPSRASLLTGLYPIHTGSQHFVIINEEPWGILENQTTMAEIFQAHGYSTNLVGKWHLGMGRRAFTPTFNGFDYHYGYWGGYIDYFRKRCKMPTNFSMGYDFRRNLQVECPPQDSYATDLFTSEAERIILENNGSKPLFLLVSHLATHAANDDDPLQAPPEEIEKFSYIPDIRRRTYAAMLSKLDESVGRIIHALDKGRMLNNSIILFYSDNGAPSLGLFSNTGSNWPLRGQKHSPWEGGLRVAGAIWSPLLKNRASIYQQPIYVGDWLPTLAAAAKIELHQRVDGLNVWPYLAKSQIHNLPQKYQEREIIHMMDDIWNLTSYMKGSYKYIKGTTLKGIYDEVLLARNPNVTDPRNKNYESAIRSSLASKSLEKYDQDLLTNEKIHSLRLQAEIQCGTAEGPLCNPLREECLFNILLDPCEQNNLAFKPEFQNILQQMRAKVKSYRKTSIKAKTGGSILDYDPSRHNCLWTNYVEDTPFDSILQCDYHSPPCQDLSTNNVIIPYLVFIVLLLSICMLLTILFKWKCRNRHRQKHYIAHVPVEGTHLQSMVNSYTLCPIDPEADSHLKLNAIK